LICAKKDVRRAFAPAVEAPLVVAHEVPSGHACGTAEQGGFEVGHEVDGAGLRIRVDFDAIHERLDKLAVLELWHGPRRQVVDPGEPLLGPGPQLRFGDRQGCGFVRWFEPCGQGVAFGFEVGQC